MMEAVQSNCPQVILWPARWIGWNKGPPSARIWRVTYGLVRVGQAAAYGGRDSLTSTEFLLASDDPTRSRRENY